MNLQLRARRLYTPATVCFVFIALAATACGGSKSAEPKKEAETKPAASAAASVDPKAAAEGKELATANGCAACHSVNGSTGIGPTWKGLHRSSVPLVDGSSVTADDAFLKESIVTPNAKIVKGFAAGVMPGTYGQSLNDKQVQSLVEYIKSLP